MGECKIGIVANDCRQWEEERYKKLYEFGYRFVDFDLVDTNSKYYQCSEEELKAMLLKEKQLMEEAGIVPSQAHGPWRWPPQDGTAEQREERMEKMKQSIRATALLGCKNWVIHPLMPYGIYDIGTGHEAETWSINKEFMQELLETAKEYGVTICFENMPMPQFSIGSPQQILEFVKEMDDEFFKICLDTGHVAVYPDGNPAEAARLMKDEIRVLHVHDNDGQNDCHWLPYFGVIDWQEFGEALREIDFQGVFSYEVEPPITIPAPINEEIWQFMVDIAEDICMGKPNEKE